ncbi:hypothetical protein [Methanoculleus sp.]|uniref:hypothetical protein n=1 Tax=Methanoculleus sp. TaxID=90427 RepID=UPI001BD1BCE9|nr:hypothetical protein [Methanoculleus sp.]
MWKRVLAALVLVAATLGAGCLGGLLHPAVVPPAIVPVEGAALDDTPAYTFPFEDGEETIRVDPDPAVYAGAKNADRQLYLFKDLPKEEWIPIYYLAFVNDSHQEPFYADLLAAFRESRDREGLDDDRYLELIAAFVQSIPYETDASTVEPKFPIETYVDAEGDCDDKSLLLAGLLAREGYGVALLYFGDEAHMAVGVESAGCFYRNTTYAYIEATNASYVGIPPAALADGTVLSSDPLVIPVGDGGKFYAACGEVETIERALSTSRDRVEELGVELAARDQELEEERASLESLGARLTALSRSGEIREYNRLVPEYNRKARDYNDAVEAYNALLEESGAAVGLHNYLVAHAHDRPGSYLHARAYLAG